MSLRLRPDNAAVAVGWLIVVTLAGRLVLSAVLGLGQGESYYVATARHLDLSYFDQPPLFLWLTWATMTLTGTEDAVVLRLPFVLMFAGTTWLMFRLTARLFGLQAGLWAAVTLNLSPVFTVTTAGWVQPDGPLMLLWMAGAYCLVRIYFDHRLRHLGRWWLALGVLLGLGLLAKYHAAFLVFGAGLFALTGAGRRTRITLGPACAAMTVAAVLFLPVLAWNYQHDWASFLFQGGRGLQFHGLRLDWLLLSIGGQAAWLAPWIWLPLVWLLARGLARMPGDDKRRFLVCLAIGPIALFTVVALWAPLGFHFHWQAPGYLMLFPLLGQAVAGSLRHRSVRWWLGGSAAATVVAVVLLASHAATGWMQAVVPGLFSAGDPTLEALEWRELRPALEKMRLLDRPDLFVVTNRWHQAGKIDRALAGRPPVLCLCRDPRNLAFSYDHRDFLGRDGLIMGAEKFLADAAGDYGRYFDSIEPAGTVTIHRGGRPEIVIRLFLARNYRKPYPMPLGPGRP